MDSKQVCFLLWREAHCLPRLFSQKRSFRASGTKAAGASAHKERARRVGELPPSLAGEGVLCPVRRGSRNWLPPQGSCSWWERMKTIKSKIISLGMLLAFRSSITSEANKNKPRHKTGQARSSSNSDISSSPDTFSIKSCWPLADWASKWLNSSPAHSSGSCHVSSLWSHISRQRPAITGLDSNQHL